MFCVKCGGELKENQMFCPVCGKVIQMVPDYNPLEDELSKNIFENTETKSKVPDQIKTVKKEKGSPIQLLAIILIVLLVIGLLITIVFISINNKKSNSYDYQIEKAYENEESENLETAIDYAQRALVLKPSDYDAQILLANIYDETGDLENAKLILKEMISLYSDELEPYTLLVSILQLEENYKELADMAERFIELENSEIKDLFKAYIVKKPEFSVTEGSYDSQVDLILSANDKSSVYYTLDGSSPIEGGILYEEAILLEEGTFTVRAVAQNSLGIYSDVVEKNYRIEYSALGVPSINPKSGIYKEATQIEVFIPEGCVAYYTFDGSIPTNKSTKYLGPIEMPEGNGIFSVVIYNEYGKSSPIEQRNYDYRLETE